MGTNLVCEAPRRPYMVGKNPDLGLAVIFRPRCKSWSCPACAAVNKSLWVARAYAGANKLVSEGETLYFLTLTSHERLNARQSVYVWPKAWAKMRDRMKYANGGTFQYLMVPEQHHNGRLHIHAIETAGLGKGVIKTMARESGLGYMDDESAVKTPTGAAMYVSKYLGKQLEFTRWPKGFRRVRTSRQWAKLPPREGVEGWEFGILTSEYDLQAEIDRLESVGYWVNVLDHLAAWDVVNGKITADGEVIEEDD